MQLKREKHVFIGAHLVPLVMTMLGKLCPSAEAYLLSLPGVACCTGAVDRGPWLRIAKHLQLQGPVIRRLFVLHVRATL